MANGFQTISSALNTHVVGNNNFKSPVLSGGAVAVRCHRGQKRLSIREPDVVTCFRSSPAESATTEPIDYSGGQEG